MFALPGFVISRRRDLGKHPAWGTEEDPGMLRVATEKVIVHSSPTLKIV